MKKLNWKEILLPAAALTVICLVVTAALGVTNELTKGPIAVLQEETERASRQQVLPQAQEFTEIEYEGLTDAPYEGRDASGQLVGYVIVTQAKGYGGTIQVMTGIDTSGTVTGVNILSHSETVGLGANAAKPEFTDQYQKPIPEDGFVVEKNGKDGDAIQALTGATITSNAVTDAVNSAVKVYEELSGKGEA